jgi:hypothetical protein
LDISGLDTTVIGGSMQHDSWIGASFYIQRAGVLSPRFSINPGQRPSF